MPSSGAGVTPVSALLLRRLCVWAHADAAGAWLGLPPLIEIDERCGSSDAPLSSTFPDPWVGLFVPGGD